MKILVSDFDLTLYDHNFQENIKEIKNFVNKGNKFIIATGRNFTDLLREIKDCNLPCSYYICKDGATIYNNKKELIYRKDIDNKTVKKVIDFLENTNNFEIILVDNTKNYVKNCDEVNAIIAKPKDFVYAKKILEDLKNSFNDIDGYLSRNWININHISCNKATGINYLINLNNYDKNNIYTVGDTVNDYKMIKMFKGFAMECADDNLKKISIDTVKNFNELIKKINS